MKKKIFCCLVLISLLFYTSKVKLFAADDYLYNVCFDYTCYYVNNTSEKVISSGKNVEEITIVDSKGSPGELSINLIGNKNCKKTVLSNNDYLNSTDISISVNTTYEICSTIVYDSNNQIVEQGSSWTNLMYLEDDTYTVEIECSGTGNNVSGRIYEKYYTVCSFSFTVDTTPPTITGASLSMSGKYIRGSFSVTGVDELSGINRIYMLEPGQSSYQEITSGSSLSSSKNGLIMFYAVDNAGNSSAIYYIYNDIEKPTGLLYKKDGTIITSTYTTTSFYFKASDSYSGVLQMYILYPGDQYWSIYNGQLIDSSYKTGSYKFMATDYAGNMSEYKAVYYSNTVSKVEIKQLDNSNKVYLTWDNDDYEVTVNSLAYNKNDIIADEGNYNVKITDKSGMVSNITFTITCYFKLLKIIPPTCIDQGYSIYTCISCGNQELSDYTTNGSHSYDQYYVEPTCLKSGGVYSTCIYCKLSYMLNEVAPLSHNYITSITKSPTCNNVGKRHFECSRCGIKKDQEISKLNHDYMEYSESKSGRKTYKTYKCTLCNMTKSEVVELDSDIILTKINLILDNYFSYVILILLITSSIWSIFIGIKIMVIRNNDDQVKVRRMVKNYIIGLIIIFIILLAIPLLIKGISSII